MRSPLKVVDVLFAPTTSPPSETLGGITLTTPWPANEPIVSVAPAKIRSAVPARVIAAWSAIWLACCTLTLSSEVPTPSPTVKLPGMAIVPAGLSSTKPPSFTVVVP